MKIETYIDSLVSCAMNTGLADPLDHQVLTNRLLDTLRIDIVYYFSNPIRRIRIIPLRCAYFNTL